MIIPISAPWPNGVLFVGFDRFGLPAVSDETRIRNIVQLIEDGFAKQILLSHDSVTCWQGRPLPFAPNFDLVLNQLPDWRPTQMFRKVLPAIVQAGVDPAVAKSLLNNNPLLFFQGKQ